MSHLDADLIGLGWCYLYLLYHHRLLGLPGYYCLALDDLKGKVEEEENSKSNAND